MKAKLLFAKQRSNALCTLLVLCLSFNFGMSQNLMANPTCDLHGTGSGSTSDNADSYDMTPNNEIKDETGANIPSPYQSVWDNDDLEDWLEVFYLGAAGSLDEQPGSTSSGNNGTRGVKLYDDGNPVITGCSRRLYQKVEGLTIGMDYTFSVESRSEAMNTPSEVYMLNSEIADELGINANGGADASVDGFMTITNDFDAFTSNSLTFTATNTFVVVYVRSLSSVDGATEVFYDNFSLVAEPLSVADFSASNVKIYPNPANDYINIESNVTQISKVVLYDILGKKVLSQNELTNNRLDISSLTKGVYFMKINANGNSITKKIIKK
jgi:hypothetical protein